MSADDPFGLRSRRAPMLDIEPDDPTRFYLRYDLADDPGDHAPWTEWWDAVVSLAGVEVWRERVGMDSRVFSIDAARAHHDRIVMGAFAARLAAVLNPEGEPDAARDGG